MDRNSLVFLKIVLFIIVCLLALIGIASVFSGWTALGFSAIVILYMLFGADEITAALQFGNFVWPKLDLFNKESKKTEQK